VCPPGRDFVYAPGPADESLSSAKTRGGRRCKGYTPAALTVIGFPFPRLFSAGYLYRPNVNRVFGSNRSHAGLYLRRDGVFGMHRAIIIRVQLDGPIRLISLELILNLPD
jgi:hypothetical protein